MTIQNKRWERVKSEPGPDLKIFKARFDHMKNPRNGKTERMIVLEANDSVNVVALTKDEKILFVRQYRFGIEGETLELPGGIVDDGEDHGVAAQRELGEETGYTGEQWDYLGKVPSNPVFMDSWIHHWAVREVQETDIPQLDDGEEVQVVLLEVEEVRRRLMVNAFLHTHTTNALLCFFNQSNLPTF